MVTTDDSKTFTLSSSAFTHNSDIPSKFTCEGDNISPPLKWENSPAGTKTYVLIMDDPDAPSQIWDHWILFNIPAETSEFEKDIAHLPNGAKHGKNSWGEMKYGGPCPPKGKHRYYFKIYALGHYLTLDIGVSKAKLLTAMEGHILAKAELMGYYEKKKS